MTRHAVEQTVERLAPVLGAERARELLERAARFASRAQRSVALRLARLPRMVGDPWSNESNGDDVWAVCRDGRVVTVMFRRSSQPAVPGAFGVEEVRG